MDRRTVNRSLEELLRLDDLIGIVQIYNLKDLSRQSAQGLPEIIKDRLGRTGKWFLLRLLLQVKSGGLPDQLETYGILRPQSLNLLQLLGGRAQDTFQ